METKTIDSKNVVLLTVSVTRLTNTHKADLSEIETSADKSYLGLTRKPFKLDSYDAIVNLDRRFYCWLRDRSIPLLNRRGLLMVGRDVTPMIDEEIEAYKRTRSGMVETFVRDYLDCVSEMRARLNGQFSERDYLFSADAIRRRFAVEHEYLSFGIPESLPDAVKSRAMDEAKERLAAIAVDVELTLREGFLTLIDHLSYALAPDASGRTKRFMDSRVDAVLEFIDVLSPRNFINDSQLIDITEKTKALIMEVKGGDYTTSAAYKDTLREKITGVVDTVKGMVQETKKVGRKFNFDV